MNFLADESGNTCALIYNNIILLPDGEVMAVILGHCVFGKTGSLKGKFIQKILYDIPGRIVAKEKGSTGSENWNTSKIIQSGWEIIQKIEDHQCPWINPSVNWSTEPVKVILS